MSRSDGLAVETKHDPVLLLLIGNVDVDVAYFVMRSLKKFFQSCENDMDHVPPVKVIRRPMPKILDELKSEDILMEEVRRTPGKLVLGVTDAGLFDSDMNRYIFGYGSSGAAVMSTLRFRMIPGGKEVMKERLGKEIIKVLSLALNVGSCPRHDCILMHHRKVEELDANVDVCPDCRARLGRGINYAMKQEKGDECT